MVEVHVLQGERPMAADNVSLGKFHLMGIPPAPRGIPQIEVTFDIDANGIMHVSAKDLGTGKEQKITITASTKLTQEQIDKMVKDAERFAEKDKEVKERIEVKNQAENLLYSAERLLKDHSDKIGDTKGKIEDASKELRETLKSDDISKIKEKMDELMKHMHEASAKMYGSGAGPQQDYQGYSQSNQAQAGTDSTSTTEETEHTKEPEGKTVDAEYKVIDDKKKKK
jgi:molecular chaperone DnaK